MIIKVDFSPAEAGRCNRADLSELVSELARASLLGYHRIVIPRALSKWFIQNLDLSDRHKRHIEKVGQEYAQLGGQVDTAPLKVLITADAEGVGSDQPGAWILGLAEIIEGRYLAATSLILENAQNDGAFYEMLLQMSSKRAGFGDISFEVYHGGGNGCAQEVRRLSGQRRMVACVCDTDLTNPWGAKSATHNAVAAEFGRSAPVGIFLGTPGREIENFLPLSIIRKLTDQVQAADFLEARMQAQGRDVAALDCLWLYFDVKEGIPNGSLEASCRNDDARQWAALKYGVGPDQIAHVSVAPLGQNLLAEFMQSNSLKGEFHRHVKSRYWETHFSSWAEKLLWMLAGRKRERVS